MTHELACGVAVVAGGSARLDRALVRELASRGFDVTGIQREADVGWLPTALGRSARSAIENGVAPVAKPGVHPGARQAVAR